MNYFPFVFYTVIIISSYCPQTILSVKFFNPLVKLLLEVGSSFIRLRKFYEITACTNSRPTVTFSYRSSLTNLLMPTKPAKTAKTSAPKAPAKTKNNSSPSDLIEKASLQALKTLQSLGIEQQLQQDIEWCLGSYRHDKNPEGC